MKQFIQALVFSVTTFLFACSNGQTNYNLSAEAFSSKLQATPDGQLIDVRTPEEFSAGHIGNAMNIDWTGNNFNAQTVNLDKSKPVFIYCLSGGRSASAAKNMRSGGFKEVYELDGGLMKWRAAGFPETTESPSVSSGMTRTQFDSIINSNATVLVDFYAEWCAPCKKMKPSLEAISKEYDGKVLLLRIDADANPQLCKGLNIEALPTLMVYKNKNLTWSNTGYIEKKDILKQLE